LNTPPASLTFRPSPHFLYSFEGARLIEAADSPYQHIDVRDTPMLGRLFALDGRAMTSAGDEFIYQVHGASGRVRNGFWHNPVRRTPGSFARYLCFLENA
jgi:hypothetical protein